MIFQCLKPKPTEQIYLEANSPEGLRYELEEYEITHEEVWEIQDIYPIDGGCNCVWDTPCVHHRDLIIAIKRTQRETSKIKEDEFKKRLENMSVQDFLDIIYKRDKEGLMDG